MAWFRTYVLRIAIVVVGLAGLLIAGLLTTSGQRAALSLVSNVVATKEFSLSIGRLEGSLFDRGSIERIVVSDRHGPWLELNDVELSWSVLSLLHNHIDIEKLAIGSLKLARLPVQTDRTSPRSGGPSLRLVPFKLKQLQVDQLLLGKELVGAAARFRVEANANLVDHRNGLAASISAERLDQQGAHIEARFEYGNEDRKLAVQLMASEPANGLVASFLKLPQRPALQLKLSGEGPVDMWRADWSLSASGQRFVAGRVQIDRDGTRHRLATDFSGYVQEIIPRGFANLAPGKTVGSLVGFYTDPAQFEVSEMLLRTDAVRLRGRGGFEPASSYAYGSVLLDVARADGRPIELMLSTDEQLALGKLWLKLELPDKRTGRELLLDVGLKGLAHRLGAAASLHLVSRAEQTDPLGANALSAERLTVNLTADGLTSSLNGFSEAIGARTQLKLGGAIKSGVLAVDHFRLGDETAYLVGRANLSEGRQSASVQLTVADLRRFSEISGQPLAGRLDLNATTSASIAEGAYAISFKGATEDLALGRGVLAGLVGKKAELSGDVQRTAKGDINVKNLAMTGDNLLVAVDGLFGRSRINLVHRLEVGSLSALDSRLSGAGKIEVGLHGAPNDLLSKIRGTTSEVRWLGQPVERLALQFDGKGPVAAHLGQLRIDGRVGQKDFSGKARLSLSENRLLAAKNIAVRIGRNALSGEARLATTTWPAAKFVLDAPHLSDLDAIVGQEISGALSGELELFERQQLPSIRLSADAPIIAFAGTTLKKLKATAALSNVTGDVTGHASMTLGELSNDDATARNVSVELRERKGRMAFASSARINDASARVDGSFKQHERTVDIVVDRANLKQGALHLRLADRAQLAFADGGVRIQQLRLTVGRGQVALDGRATSKAINLNANLSRVPAAIANAFLPSLGLGGTITGRASFRGLPANPTAAVKATWRQASAGVMRENHIPPVRIKLNGKVRDGTAEARIDVSGPQALGAVIDGNVTLNKENRMRLRVSGNVPLALANAALAARATQISGRAKVEGTVSGTLDAPQVDARISIPNASVHDPSSGVKLRRVVGLLNLTERELEIRQLKGDGELGGTVSVNGSISRGGQVRPRVRVNAQLAQFIFNDQQLMAGEVDSNITVAGPLDALAASGKIFVRRLDVTVPAAVPRSITALNVRHINAPQHVKKSAIAHGKPASNSAPMSIDLNLRLDAANRIFVKGRGLDTQLGGGLNVRGTSKAPVTDGAFVMQRGRLDILGRRLDFQRGRIAFDGALEPILDMEAVTVADEVTIVVTISGVASRPVFKFSSRPELPEDEVIARLLFNKGLVGLSPLQLAQLASEVDKIGGLSNGPGILDQLKRSIGVDVLDVSTDNKGAATVSAGRYVTDKTFVGVKQGATAGSSRVIIDHDFTKNLKARGEIGADGNSKLGIGLEWNY
ncbi:MAG: translocation/assembly module TamB domain-containing protein [Hyphomicrobiaceae bacterium]